MIRGDAEFQWALSIQQRGQSIQEYGVVIALTLLVSVGALTALGGNISSLFGGVNQTVQGSEKSGFSGLIGLLESPAKPGAGKPSASIPPDGTPATTGTLGYTTTIDPKTGHVVFTPITASNSATSSSSVDGTTRLLSQTLLDMADTLLQEGKITEAQATQIKALSNKGHLMADVQELMARQAENWSPTQGGLGAPMLNFNGEYIDMGGLASSIGLMSANYGLAGQNGKYMQDFIDLKTSVISSVQDPAVKMKLTNLTNEIMALSDETENTFWSFETNPEDSRSLTQKAMDSYVSLYGTHQDVHQASGQICETGNGTDTGTQCK